MSTEWFGQVRPSVTFPRRAPSVEDIKQSLKLLLDAGAEAQQAIKDVGGGKLIATVKDADGNIIGLIQSP